MDSKIEILSSKSVLSPTRSVDEGFESDPDRISTDSSEQAISTSATSNNNNLTLPSFDILQRTDRDGVQHTQITRRHNINDYNNGPASIICLQGQIENEVRLQNNENGATATSKVTIPRAGSINQLNQDRYRRQKTRAPPPPIPAVAMRSQSVDAIRQRDYGMHSLTSSTLSSRSNHDYTKYTTRKVPTNKLNHHPLHSGSIGNLKQSSIQPPTTKQILSQTNSLYTFYPAEGSISLYPSHYGLTYKSSHMNIQTQAPISWTQSVPRQARRYIFCIIFYIYVIKI